MARKKKGAFRTISEVSKWLDTPTHVIRFWESKFKQIEPVKRAGGRRYYRPEDLPLIGGIKVLLHDEGKSIASVAEMIAADGEEAVRAKSPEVKFERARKPRKASQKADVEAKAEAETSEETQTSTDTKEEASDTETTTSTNGVLQTSDALELTNPVSDEVADEAAETAAETQEDATEPMAEESSSDDQAGAALTLTDMVEEQSDSTRTQVNDLSISEAKVKENLGDIEELYFDLQMMRNRIKRALRALQ